MSEQHVTGSGSRRQPEVSVVVPVLNEEDAIPVFVAAVVKVLDDHGIEDVEILFVDDGSTDETWRVIREVTQQVPAVAGIRLSRNVGKECALTAGLANARGRAHIPMDVDLQDPPDLLPVMISRWRSGARMVLCRRVTRRDSATKRWTAWAYYRLAARSSHVTIPPDVGDFRLLDAEVTQRFLRLPERNRFNKGLFALVSPHDYEVVDYERPVDRGRRPRQGWGRLFSLAIDGFVSFSVWPLRALSVVGFLMLALAIVGAITSVVLRMMDILEVPGQATVVLIGFFLAGFQALSIGVLGEYVARVLIEVKGRPLYEIDDTVRSGSISAPPAAQAGSTDSAAPVALTPSPQERHRVVDR